jgi:Zn ribbon nucleic-acid-binding protein
VFEFLQRYGTEEQCEAALEAARWPSGFVCPRCEGRSAWAFRRGAQPYRECAGCGYQCSLIAGTLFQASKLPLTRWFMAMQLLSQAKNNVAALELRRQLGVSYPTAWLLKHKIMEAMRQAESQRHPAASPDAARRTRSPSCSPCRPPMMAGHIRSARRNCRFGAARSPSSATPTCCAR